MQEEWASLFHLLLESAENEDPEVWFALGHGHGNGWGTERDPAASERCFRKAAEGGHLDGMVRLANRLHHPERSNDWPEAIEWLRRAADADNASGMVFLGFAYREGKKGVPTEYETAAKWFINAYEAGDRHAAIHAARIFAHYLSRPDEAITWYRRAADAGQRESFIGLAMLYDDRDTDCYDPAEAVKWYQIAVAKNGTSIPRSLLALARHYRDGVGVPRDPEITRAWLRRLLDETPETNEFHQAGRKLMSELETELL